MNSNIFRLQHYKLRRTFSLNVCKLKKSNHYDCLGITPKSTQGDIKTAYYKLSKQYHPDMNRNNKEAAEKFRDITAAYEVLGNLKSRKLYDRGLLIGTQEEIYTSEESKDYNYKHASFHKQRNKPVKPEAKVQSTNYDIDEWTRAHYSSIFSSSFKQKIEKQVNIDRDKNSLQEHRSVVQMTLFVCTILVLFACMFEVIESNFDQPTLTTEDKKRD